MTSRGNVGVGSPFFLQITAGYDSPPSAPWTLNAGATPQGREAGCA
jgi:hypothetical protein